MRRVSKTSITAGSLPGLHAVSGAYGTRGALDPSCAPPTLTEAVEAVLEQVELVRRRAARPWTIDAQELDRISAAVEELHRQITATCRTIDAATLRDLTTTRQALTSAMQAVAALFDAMADAGA